jgi:hypothetical protein
MVGRDDIPQMREDKLGQSPPDVSGQKEAAFFNADAALHAHAMRKLELGWIGFLVGDPTSAPTNIALLCIVAGMALCAVSVIYARTAGTDVEFWHSFTERSLAFVGTALAFIFGRGSVK